MKSLFRLLAVAACGSGLVHAQDSVSKLLAVPGDSIDAYVPAEQINDFVVDLSAFRSSWNETFAVAPLVKASLQQDQVPSFFTHLISSQAMSKTVAQDAPFLRDSYMFWDQAGFGVNDDGTKNDPGTPINTQGLSGNQFALAFAEFGQQPSGADSNNIIGAIVNADPDFPSRLYVSRVNAAVNSPNYDCELAQFGIGGVEAAGTVAFRADDFGPTDGCGFTAVSGNNYFRVDMAARGLSTNVIHAGGGTDAGATTHVVDNAGTVHITPAILPAGLGGPSVLGMTFGSDYFYEPASYTQTYLPPNVFATRGAVAHTPLAFPANFGASPGGTCAILGIDQAAQNNEVTELVVWGINASGAPTGNVGLSIPAVITDPEDGWMSNALGSGQLEFTNHQSQTPFRGGNGQVAVGRDVSTGELLVAATVDHPSASTDDHPTQLIAVARVDGSGNAEWIVAAHNDNSTGVSGTGKAIKDGPGGQVIGRLIGMGTVTGGSLFGPSIGPPMMDSVGNLYFVAGIERFLDGGGSDVDTALVRAVYNPDEFEYELELLVEVGDVFLGQNSSTPYQVRFIDLVDSGSIGSTTAFSGNITAGAFNNLDPSTLAPRDSRALGGLVLNVQIIYDGDGDGSFDIQTGGGGMPSDDEDYRVMLYVGSAEDCNGNGVPDDLDILRGDSLDQNGNGVPDECEGEIGDKYCISVPNSTGSPASISATGTGSVSANDVVLRSSPCPPNQNGLFFYGPNQIQLAFGNGFRCVGGQLFRLPLINAGATGEFVWALDVTSPPSAAGQITPGSTWNFQCWFRDPAAGGSFFNLSNGLQIQFTP